jgi:hypothetical protein
VRAPFRDALEAAVAGGVDHVLAHQDEDGLWREFELEPGASEAWVTAWVGWCLARAVVADTRRRARILGACQRAAAALRRARRPGGWGYNRRTGPDADTTAWVLRFFACLGVRADPGAYLAPYVDPGGGVHTFQEPGWGTWTDAHDDVAANAGLALLTAPTTAVETRRTASRIAARLAARFPGETFWWSTPTYGTAWSLRLLAIKGALAPLAPRAQDWLASLPRSDSAFELAHRLLAALEITGEGAQLLLANQLLDLRTSGSWEGSTFLLVPDRNGGVQSESNSELHGLLGNALCVMTLSAFLWMADRPAAQRPALAAGV